MRLVLAALLIPLAGCTLVDQRSFQAASPAPGAAEIGRAGTAGVVLVSVRMDQPGQDYRQRVAEAVQGAQQLRPDARFDVLALVPTQVGPAEQDRRIAEASADARAVAEVIGAAGISSERLHLGLRGDPGSPAREVRVYLR